MYTADRLTQLADYVRKNPIKSWTAASGLAGLLLSVGIVATGPTQLSPKYLIQYIAGGPLMFAGAAALSVWLTQGIEARIHKS